MPGLRAIWALCVTTSNIYDLVSGNSGNNAHIKRALFFSTYRFNNKIDYSDDLTPCNRFFICTAMNGNNNSVLLSTVQTDL